MGLRLNIREEAEDVTMKSEEERYVDISKLGPVGAILGRIFVAVLFIVNGIGLIGNFGAVQGMMETMGLPVASVLLVVTIVLQIGGGVLILLGRWQAETALIIAVWLIIATLVFHAPWSATPDTFDEQMIHFLKNIGLLGAMMLLVATDRRNVAR